jgi:uroporphyrinogen-III synthase
VIPLFSPRTASLFAAQTTPSASILLAAMSDQVAEAAKPLNAAAMCVAAEPTLEDMVIAVEKLVLDVSAG